MDFFKQKLETVYFKRCSFYEALLLCVIHGILLIKCQSALLYYKILFFIMSLLQIILRIIGYQSSDELISTWFYERPDSLSFGLSYVFYLPQIFLLGLLINHENSYKLFIESIYANQLIDYLYFSLWLYILAITILLFRHLVYQSKILNGIILICVWLAFYYGFYSNYTLYLLLAFGFSVLMFIGATYIKHTWSFGEFSSILLTLTTAIMIMYDNFYVFIIQNDIFQNNTEWIQTLKFSSGILLSIPFIVITTVLLLFLRTKFFIFSQTILSLSFPIILNSVCFLIITTCICTQKLPYNLLNWIFTDFMNKKHRWYQFYWCLFVSSFCSFYTFSFFKFSSNISISRKLYHIFLCCTIMPLLFFDKSFTIIITATLLNIFIIFEMIRIYSDDIVSKTYYSIIRNFLDERDNGSLVVSHLNLLLGTSLPIWLKNIVTYDQNNFQFISSYQAILVNCGLISIGIGDTIACIFGIKFGKHSKKVFDSNKTLIGMFSSFFVQFFVFFFIFYFNIESSINIFQLLFSTHSIFILIISFLSSLLELLTSQNDNLMIPLILFPVIATFL